MAADDLNEAIAGAIKGAAVDAGVELTEDKHESAREVAVEEPAGEEAAAAETEDEKPEPESKPEPKAAKPAEDDGEEFYNPTAEELAVIEKSPELKKAYKALRRGFTQKTTELKKQGDILKDKAEIADWIQKDPDAAAAYIAERRGFRLTRAEVAEAKSEVAESIEDEWSKTIGPEAAKLLRPLIQKTITNVLKTEVEPKLALAEEASAAVNKQAQERGIAAAVARFENITKTAGGDWDEDIQAEMAARINRLKPADNVSIDQYLEDIYDGVTASRLKLKAVTATRDRLRRIRDENEPVVTSRPAPNSPKKITIDMKDKDAIALAVEQAQAQVRAAR